MNASTWMKDLWPQIKDKTLSQIALPGSHDAGMSRLSDSTSFSNECNTRTQSVSIAEQLRGGSRYFDIRPTYWSGKLYAGHFSSLPIIGWQGAVGEVMSTILDDVATFASQNPTELIILKFSHYIDYNAGAGFTLTQKQQLKDMVAKHRTLSPRLYKNSNSSINLNTILLRDIVPHGNVLCVFDSLYGCYDSSVGIFSFGDQRDNLPIDQSTGNAPALAMGPGGTLYTLFTKNNDSSILFCSSRDGGRTWSNNTPIKQSTGHAPSLAVGPDGTLYTLFTKNGDSSILFCSSTDGGKTWSNNIPIKQSTSHTPSLAVGPNGTLYTLFTKSGGGSILFCSSRDGGKTWSDNIPINQSTGNAPSLAVGPDGTLYTLFTKNGGSSILFCSSRDGGKTWSDNIPINESTGNAPSLAVGPDGTLYTLFTKNNGSSILLCTSTNGGKSWTANLPIDQASALSPSLLIGPDGAKYSLFVKNGGSSILCSVSTPGPALSWVAQRGGLYVYDDYADSDDVNTVIEDQKKKFISFSPGRDNQAFLLSWTGTCTNGVLPCIGTLAQDLNGQLYSQMTAWQSAGVIKQGRIPNIIYVDYYNNTAYDFMRTISYLNRL